MICFKLLIWKLNNKRNVRLCGHTEPVIGQTVNLESDKHKLPTNHKHHTHMHTEHWPPKKYVQFVRFMDIVADL